MRVFFLHSSVKSTAMIGFHLWHTHRNIILRCDIEMAIVSKKKNTNSIARLNATLIHIPDETERKKKKSRMFVDDLVYKTKHTTDFNYIAELAFFWWASRKWKEKKWYCTNARAWNQSFSFMKISNCNLNSENGSHWKAQPLSQFTETELQHSIARLTFVFHFYSVILFSFPFVTSTDSIERFVF